MQMERFYTAEETAKLIRCNAWHIRYMLRNGILRGVKVSPKAWRVPESAMEILARLSFPKTLMSQGRGQRIFLARSRACGPFQLFCFAPKTEVFTRQ